MIRLFVAASLLTLVSTVLLGQAAVPPDAVLTPGEPVRPYPYDELDANEDGNLSEDEYGRLFPDRPYAALDTNGDGRVSEKEYLDGARDAQPDKGR